jgi:hypothetical protein
VRSLLRAAVALAAAFTPGAVATAQGSTPPERPQPAEAQPAPEAQPPARSPEAPPAPAPRTEPGPPADAPPPQPSGGTAPAPGGTTSGGSISGGSISGGTVSSGNISGANISGATISGVTISGATIVGGTISGGTISGGTIAGSKISDSTIDSPPRPAGKGEPPKAPAPSEPRREAPATPAPPRDEGANRAPGAERRARGEHEPGRPARGAAAPGDDDEDAAAHALQRTLVQRGALLLPLWGVEIGPAVTYGHTSDDTFVTVAGASEGAPPTTLGVRRRTHQLAGVLTARVGLPWDLQVDASAPVLRVWSDVTVGGSVRSNAFGTGLGDARVSLTRQVLRARGALPDLLVAATWKSRAGSSPFDARPDVVGLGTGYPAVGATLTAVKTSDPLVLLASASYTANLGVTTKQGRREPADTWGLGGGAILAVSPETSLSFLLDTHYKPEDRLGGKAVIASDETFAVLQLGLGTIVSRRVLLNFTVGVGLTADSPDVQLGVSMPVRF